MRFVTLGSVRIVRSFPEPRGTRTRSTALSGVPLTLRTHATALCLVPRRPEGRRGVKAPAAFRGLPSPCLLWTSALVGVSLHPDLPWCPLSWFPSSRGPGSARTPPFVLVQVGTPVHSPCVRAPGRSWLPPHCRGLCLWTRGCSRPSPAPDKSPRTHASLPLPCPPQLTATHPTRCHCI